MPASGRKSRLYAGLALLDIYERCTPALNAMLSMFAALLGFIYGSSDKLGSDRVRRGSRGETRQCRDIHGTLRPFRGGHRHALRDGDKPIRARPARLRSGFKSPVTGNVTSDQAFCVTGGLGSECVQYGQGLRAGEAAYC